ncbi:MAG: porin family protein [Vicingaceae bacterium]
MKKLAFLITSTILIFNLSNLEAQENKAGVKGGLNYSTMTGDDIDGAKAQAKYHIGGFATIGITEFFALQPELLYSKKGANSDNGDLNLSTLDVPFLAKIYLSDNFNIHAGPQLGVPLQAEVEANGETEDIKEQFKDLYLEGVIGIEFETDMGLMFGARYNASLGSIGDEYEAVDASVPGGNVTVTADAPDYKNSVIQAFVGFSF